MLNKEIVTAWTEVAKIINSVDASDEALMAFMCTIVDMIAGKMNRKGYEVIEAVLPIMHEVGDSLGVAN